jgi:NAD(P)-dependent dehydrogenase (short-subunit alcohol dehydrogenase family)
MISFSNLGECRTPKEVLIKYLFLIILARNQKKSCSNGCPNTLPLAKRYDMGRAGLLENPGGAAVFLASAASDYITGQIIIVDGGWMVG